MNFPGFTLFSRLARRRRAAQLAALILGFVVALPGYAQLSDEAQRQIARVYALKSTFTPAEKKMSSNLVLLSRESRHMPLGGMAKMIDRSRIEDAQGRMLVDIGADLTPSLMTSAVMKSLVQEIGGDVPQYAYTQRRLGLKVRASQLLELASHPDVQSIDDGDRPTTNVGSITSQGYVTHTANKAVAAGYTGAGVTVGVMSDSATPARVSALIASGDLPANTIVVPGQSGGSGTDEGAAMMEIVHDMAPGANIVFATAYNTQANFAANIKTLRFTYHCDIIVDDISYFAEGVFQDGTVAQAVNAVTADGALYFSAAANSGNLTLGTSGTWEGDFTDGGPVTGVINTGAQETGELHTFTTGQTYDVLTALGSGVSLKWSDPLGKADDDYDLFILDSTGTVLKGFSAASQNGTQDPFEFIGTGTNCGLPTATGYCGAAGDRVVVVLYSGTQKALHVDTLRGRLSVATTGSTYGHNAGKNTFGMAATYWNSGRAGTTAFKGGAANPIETFSSDGPRKVFFNPDGTEIVPGNDLFSTGGGVTLQKPDGTAADGVFTKTPGFLPFFGTSAAAPHAAGIAALVKSARPTLTNLQIRSILTSTALDNMAPGVDRDSGYGILMALPAVQAALLLP